MVCFFSGQNTDTATQKINNYSVKINCSTISTFHITLEHQLKTGKPKHIPESRPCVWLITLKN